MTKLAENSKDNQDSPGSLSNSKLLQVVCPINAKYNVKYSQLTAPRNTLNCSCIPIVSLYSIPLCHRDKNSNKLKIKNSQKLPFRILIVGEKVCWALVQKA